MSDAAVSMEVRRESDRVSVIDIKGDVTAASEGELMDAYNAAGDSKVIALNFEGLEYMNSGGIGLLVTLLVRAKRQRQTILAFGLNEHYRQIFELTRLDDAISLYDSEDEALASAR